MRARSEQLWIAGLGAVAAVLLIVLVVVLMTGGDDGEAAATPAVSIESLRATGFDATLDFTVDGHDDPSEVSIDWGDGSNPLALRGAGALSASHTYPAEDGERIVVVTATLPDGTVLRASRPVVVGAGGPGGSTSTTEDPDASTTTTEDPDGSTTTTTSSTTTTRPTTTTTAPERPTIEIELVPSNAAFDQDGEGEGSARLDGRTVSVDAATYGLDGTAWRRATLTWTIPASELEGLTGEYQLRARLDPNWTVFMSTGPNRGRSAGWYVDFDASVRGRSIGTASDVRTIGNDDERRFSASDTFGFGNTFDAGELGEVTVRLRVVCEATPGETILQIGENSTCDADDQGGFTIDFARFQAVPVD